MKNRKKLSHSSKSFILSIFNCLSILVALCTPLFYLYKDERETVNGFEYFVKATPCNLLMFFSFIFLLLCVACSLLALLETKLQRKRKLSELSLILCFMEALLYTIFTFATISGLQTTAAPFSIFFSFELFIVYSFVKDSYVF